MPRKKGFVDTVTTANATPTSMWALTAGGSTDGLLDWDWNVDLLAAAINEVLASGAAITFGALRSGEAISIKIFHNGIPLPPKYCSNVYEANEVIEALVAIGKQSRKLKEAE